MSIKVMKNGFLALEKSAIKLEKVMESAIILEKLLFQTERFGPLPGHLFCT